MEEVEYRVYSDLMVYKDHKGRAGRAGQADLSDQVEVLDHKGQ